MRPLLFLSAIVFLASCKEDTQKPVPECVYTCDDMPIGVQVDAASYTPEEMDTVIIRKYLADGTFNPIQDESMVLINDTGQYTERNPVVSLTIYSGIDYEIVIPGAGQTYRIYDVVKPPTETHTFTGNGCNSGHFECYAYTRQCAVNGGNYSIDNNGMTTVILKH